MTQERKYEYVIQLSVDLLKVAPAVGDDLQPLQSALTSCGLGRLAIRSKVVDLRLTSGKALNREERETVKGIALKTFRETLPDWDWDIVSIRGQPRKSCSQTRSR